MMTNDGSGALNQAADRIEAWFADAWPLWIEHGLDANGLFYEQLDHHGRPDDSVPRRTRVRHVSSTPFPVRGRRATGTPARRWDGRSTRLRHIAGTRTVDGSTS